MPAGKFNPVVLICKLSESVRVAGLLKKKKKKDVVKSVMLLPAAKGLAPVKAVYAPALKLPDTFAEGML